MRRYLRIAYTIPIVLTGVFLLISPAQAGLQCKASKPEISVKTATTNTKYIRTKSSADLGNMHGGGAKGSGKRSSVGGLGGGEIGFKTESRFEVMQEGNQACVRLKSVEVTFYAKPEIHIASNFHRGTCEYNAVLGHENTHIRILRKFVREYSPKVKQHLTRMVAKNDFSVGPVHKFQISKAQDTIQKKFMEKIEQYNNKIMPVLAKRQQAHDSAAEYARVASKCKKWDKKLGLKN
ncbi:MAG: hypothetical protein R3E13_08660 [Alphaproteobacteria bacterium]